jgi:hypothetical protein
MAETPNAEQPAAGALERVTQQLESPSGAATSAVSPIEAPPTPTVAVAAPTPVARPAVVEKSPLRQDIEAALADESLQRIYAELPPATQGKFRSAGEALAARIEQMLTIGKVNLRAAHDGIEGWLSIIPRANRWYLQQEAKTKTDAILMLASRARG